MRLRILAAILASSMAWNPVAAQEGSPIARSSVALEGGVTVGQPVTMTVELLVPTWLTGGPTFPTIEVPDAVVIFMQRGGSNLSERIDGETWSGLRREYLIYPLRPGLFAIEGEEVIVRYAIDAQPSPPTPVSIPEVSFTATVPEAAAGLVDFVSASSLSVDSNLDRSTDELRVGQSLTRTITVEAANSFAMMLPPVDYPPIEGVAVYPEDPRLSDTSGERGATRVSRRVESVTYLFQEPGSYTLPPIEISWWNSDDGRLMSSSAPGVELQVAENPDLRTEIPLAPEEAEATEAATRGNSGWDRVLRWLLPLILVAAGVALGLRWWRSRGPEWRAVMAARKRRRDESEAARFRRFRDACRGGDPSAAYCELVAWLDRATRPGTTSLAELAERSGDAALGAEISRLERLVFGGRSDAAASGDGVWRGTELYRGVARARRRMATGRAGVPAAQESLPPLNP